MVKKNVKAVEYITGKGVTLIDSLKSPTDLVTNFIGLPAKISFESYKAVFDSGFLRYFMNSVVITVCGTVGCILLSAMAAYGITRYEFKGKKFFRTIPKALEESARLEGKRKCFPNKDAGSVF